MSFKTFKFMVRSSWKGVEPTICFPEGETNFFKCLYWQFKVIKTNREFLKNGANSERIARENLLIDEAIDSFLTENKESVKRDALHRYGCIHKNTYDIYY